MHPLTRIILVLWITSLSVVFAEPLMLLALLLFALLWCILAAPEKLGGLVKALKLLVPVIISVFIVQIIFRREGQLLWSWGIVRIYSEGLVLGLQVAIRLLTIMVSAAILTVLGYQDFRVALKRLPEEISFMIAYMLYLLPVISASFRSYRITLATRGISMRKLKLRDKLKVYKVISLSVLGSLLSESQAQAIELELRGFRRQGKKSFLHRRSFSAVDIGIYLMLGLISISLILWL